MAEKTRALKWVYGIYRPKYAAESAAVGKPAASKPAVTNAVYKAGKTYTLQDAVNVRAGAGTNYGIKKVSQLTADGKAHATSTKSTANAVLKKGTKVTCLEVKTVGTYVWIRTPSGWLCAKNGSAVYLK